MIIHSDKEFSDDRLSGSDSHPEAEVTGTRVMGAKDQAAAQHIAAYKEYLADEIPRMHQHSAFASFWAEIREMFGVHKFDSEYNIDDTSGSLESSEEEQNTDASSFHEEGNTCDLETNYPLGKEVAHGGQGTISTAQDLQFGRRVAVKSLRKPENQEARHLFFTEARITAHLEHPGVVPIHTLYVDHDNAPHLAMKLVEGKSFRERLQNLKQKYASLPWYKVCAVERYQRKLRIERFLRVCEAIEYAHNRNILHRDLKPENIMVGRFGEVYVMDWGMAMVMPKGQDWVVSPICGTPRYISPEVLMHKPYGKTADIYQLGLILYETVFLRRAFPWKSKDEVLERVKAGEMAPMQHYYGCHVPATLCKIISRATAFSPRDRYQQVSDLARDLRGYLKNEATSVERHPRLSNFMRVMSRYSHLLLGLVILVTTILFAVVLYNVRSKVNEKLHEQREEEALRRLYSSNLHTSVMLAQEIKEVADDVLSLARETRVRLATLQPPNPDLNYYRGTAGMIEFPPPGYGWASTFDNKVSFRAFFWHLPTNVQVENLDAVLTTLYPMMPTFKRVLTNHFLVDKTGRTKSPIRDLGVERTPVLNSRVAFENKLMLAYPYEGNMPQDYDVTTSVWYQRAEREAVDRPIWTDLFQSVRVRNRIIIACAMPFQVDEAPPGFTEGVAVAVLDPRDFIGKFAERLTHGPYIKGHYLVHASGKVYSTDVARCQPVCQGEIGLFDFPYPEKFREMWNLKTGRVFLDDQKRDTLFIFNLVEDMNCIYIEEIDFDRAMEMDWTTESTPAEAVPAVGTAP
ncbi:MAG: serine/threonine protein kinase [Victivallales bacterium]|nr:serine/threonine protein kinase [Victivallales bacterium]